eukprot:TRINITY_DN1255_c0_g1_i1.p1 TRINITY_DN1255_c0_g1~~TRINITY_DN1255_c0_g1_i1.p1  ORF type:complete len:100 (-),score=40.85 TRINITY_DN1255_c0_g1_i1:139-393(-)
MPTPPTFFFPNLALKVARGGYDGKFVTFRVPINLTKVEVKNFLKNVYNVNVVNVTTVNYELKKRAGKRSWDRHFYKKAIVKIDE